eukprot:scaffold113107_cov35-Tisochrysis_lutea.AAC.4
MHSPFHFAGAELESALPPDTEPIEGVHARLHALETLVHRPLSLPRLIAPCPCSHTVRPLVPGPLCLGICI